MADRPEDMGMGGKMGRPINPLSQLAPSFPTLAINSLLQGNNELVPPTAAPQQSSYLFGGQAYGTNQFEQGGGGAGVEPTVNLAELLVAALMNNSESRSPQPNGHITGWPLGQTYGPLTQQQQVPRYQGHQLIGPGDRGVWGPLPASLARDARFTQPQPTGAVAPYGSSAGAPTVGSYRYGGPSWPPRPAGPAYLAGSGRSARTGLASEPTISLEEFLREQGIPIPVLADELPVHDDTANEYDALLAELMRDLEEEPGPVENVLPPSAMGFRSGPSRDQLGLGTVRVPLPSFDVGAVGGRSSYSREEAAAARESRHKKMAEKKVAAAKARAEKLAAVRGSPKGTKQGRFKPSRT